MTKQSWLDEEPGALASLRQGASLLRVGMACWLSFVASLLLALAIVGALAFGKQDHAPRLVLRVVEAVRDPLSVPQMKNQVADYVRQAVFTSGPLFQLIRRHGLYPGLMRKNSRAALDSFKEDISVSVYQNYFMQDRPAGALPRSAHLSVSYRSADRELSLAVTRELGALIIEHELAARRAQALAAADAADGARDAAFRVLELRSEQVLSKQIELRQSAAVAPSLQVEFVGLLGSLGALERRAEAAQRRANALDLNAALERSGMGLHFELVDDASLPSGRDELATRLCLAASAFVFGVPLLAMAIGAFSPQREQT